MDKVYTMRDEPDNVKALRRLGPVIKGWTPRTGAVDIYADRAVLALLDYIDRLEDRITHLENGTTP